MNDKIQECCATQANPYILFIVFGIVTLQLTYELMTYKSKFKYVYKKPVKVLRNQKTYKQACCNCSYLEQVLKSVPSTPLHDIVGSLTQFFPLSPLTAPYETNPIFFSSMNFPFSNALCISLNASQLSSCSCGDEWRWLAHLSTPWRGAKRT